MKFAEYVVWILLFKHSKFGEKKNSLQFQIYRIFSRGYFLWRALYILF